MTAEVGVLLPVRIETRFKNGDLRLRIIPDEPWFVRDDFRITAAELAALRRYATTRATHPDNAVPPAEFRDLTAAVGAARGVYLIRHFTATAPDGTTTVPDPPPERMRDKPVPPSIVGFPLTLQVWVDDDSGPHRVLTLNVDPDRLAIFADDTNASGDPRWWESWQEAVDTGVAGIIPAAEIHGPITALYVIGLADQNPAILFTHLAAEGRLGLVAPGQPTNSVDGATAASLATDPTTWWNALRRNPTDTDTDVAAAITGTPAVLGNLPGGDRPHRKPASLLVTALWPALWGFTASQVFDVTHGTEAADWATTALFPEGAYPSLRVGPQPYALMPVTAWSRWQPGADDPTLEVPLINALLKLRDYQASVARARGTAIGKDTNALLDLVADTPSSQRFCYRRAWPMELWWLTSVAAGLPHRWRDFEAKWPEQNRLAVQLGLTPLRRYGTFGPWRRGGLPLIVPNTINADDFPSALREFTGTVEQNPAILATNDPTDPAFHSLLLQLAIRSLQLATGDTVRARQGGRGFNPEPLTRRRRDPGTLERFITDATSSDSANEPLRAVLDALLSLVHVPVSELARMLGATIDCSTHRIDAWMLAVAQRRLDSLPSTAQRRLGAYGWVDAPAPATPGPTSAGLLHAPTPAAAMTAAILRDRAVNDGSSRWDLTITSRSARTAERLAGEVRAGAHLYEVVGREVERIIGRTEHILTLRTQFPLRPEHAGRRTCDGIKALAAQPLPVPVTGEQQAALTLLREAIDTYGDLLVADAVHHLVQGRAETASATMDAAAGLSRPPDLALLASPRNGRAVTSSVALALPHVDSPQLPTDEQQRAQLSPATVLDPSSATMIAAHTGDSSTWDFVVDSNPQITVTLADLELAPADALAMPLSTLQQLAAQHAGLPTTAVVNGAGADKYERAANLVGLIGRRPATTRSISEQPAADPPGSPPDPDLVRRYNDTRAVGSALINQLQRQVDQFVGNTMGNASETDLRPLLTAATRWGLTPDAADLPSAARQALSQLSTRLATAPETAADLSTETLSAAATTLISPTGQTALTGTLAATDLPALTPAPTLEQDWLTIVAAVRPALARLEAHQLGDQLPFTAWVNRGTDPWQTNSVDSRALLAVYAAPQLNLAAPAAGTSVAVTTLDRFDEVVPDAEQTTGAAFGFDAPGARAQQAILLAVPPALDEPLDDQTLLQTLMETRELAHARMARPIDLDQQYWWGVAPTGLLPATGAIAATLEPEGPTL